MMRSFSSRQSQVHPLSTACSCVLLMLLQTKGTDAALPFNLTKVRSYDGTDRPDGKGQAHETLNRIMSAHYPDISGEVMYSTPNPRTVSNIVSSQTSQILSDRSLSAMVWQFGQILDHDFGITDSGAAFGEAHIPLEDDDDFFAQSGCSRIDFFRSQFEGVPRQHINSITAFIDASFVYGSDHERAARLRSMQGGLMLMTPVPGSKHYLLPFNFETDPLPNGGGTSSAFFVSGDIRANEQLGLTAMHTLFAREHNRLCTKIRDTWGTVTDEEIYQLARKIVGAEMQIITYKEWLPALMGNDAPSLNDHKYDPNVDPRVMTEFTTAIFRLGHSLLHDALTLGYDKLSTTKLPLKDAFFNPRFISEAPENVDLILGGLLLDHAQEVDVFVTNEVRNFLFAVGGRTACLDLVSLNLQRGRDHGLQRYNAVRQAVGLAPKTNWLDITSDQGVARRLSIAYNGDINKVDLWVGALAEDHQPGSSIGELMTTIFKLQFERLRDGDPYFYLNDPAFLNPEMKKVFNADTFSFAKLLRDNTQIPNVPDNVFTIDSSDAEVCGTLGSITMELAD